MISRRLLGKMEKAAPELMRAGIFAPDAEEKLALYREKFLVTEPFPVQRLLFWLLRLLAIFLFLGGAVLLAWSRWMNFPPAVRILFAALPLIPVGIFSFFSIRRKPRFLRECGGVLTALAFSAFLIVVRCNTQMDWNTSDLLRETTLISLVLVWVFDSLALSGLLTLEIVVMLCWEPELLPAFYFPAALIPYFLLLIFRSKRKRLSPQIAGGLLFLLSGACAFDFLLEKPGIDGCTLFAFLTACSMLAAIPAERAWGKKNIFSVIGETLFVLYLSLAGFRFFWRGHFPLHLSAADGVLTPSVVAGIALLFLLLFSWAVGIVWKEKLPPERILFPLLLLPLPMIALLQVPAGTLAALSLLCLHALLLFYRGVRASSNVALCGGTALLLLQGLLHFFFPENFSRKDLGLIFLGFCLLAVFALPVTRKYLLCTKEEKEEETR